MDNVCAIIHKNLFYRQKKDCENKEKLYKETKIDILVFSVFTEN